MKKRSLIALTMVLMLGLCACNADGASDGGNSDVSGDYGKQEDTISDLNQGISGQDYVSGEENEESVGETGYLQFRKELFSDWLTKDVTLVSSYYQTLTLESAEYPQLQSALEQYTADYVERTTAEIDSMKSDAETFYAEYPDSFYGPYCLESDVTVKRADRKALSFTEETYGYLGGAHGSISIDGHNFDAETGEEIELWDLVTDKEALADVLTERMIAKYPDIWQTEEELRVLLNEYINPSSPDYAPVFNWILGYEGITFYFEHYEIAPYAFGVQEITLLFSEYQDIIQAGQYAPIDNNYVIDLGASYTLETDLDNDGAVDNLQISFTYNDEYDMVTELIFRVNGAESRHEVRGYECSYYLVKKNGTSYLYVIQLQESDFRLLSVFRLDTAGATHVGDCDGTIESFTSCNSFRYGKRFDLLGTYTGYTQGGVGEDGMPFYAGKVFKLGPWAMEIVSTVEIEAELLGEDGKPNGETYTFPAGTTFTFQYTDGATYTDMLADDGQKCRFYTTAEYPSTVNGLDALSSFEMLYYAG